MKKNKKSKKQIDAAKTSGQSPGEATTKLPQHIEQVDQRDCELASTFDQTSSWFLDQEGIPSASWTSKERIELVMNDEDLVRKFCCFLIAQVSDFIHHPESITIVKE